ncbi:MAG: hypothetical protein FJY82_12755 [Candidatus Aminicenantes bacterium]|nr:hypothetical protein [Candidatus Aminicenantes bacterium]
MKKILFISGSIGLGHAVRDLAMARELRRMRPDAEISWIACPPASRILRDAGEKLLPEADLWSDENASAEKASSVKTFGLNIPRYLMAARKEWKNNIEVFKRLMSGTDFDLIIGDETYEITRALKKNPAIKKAPFLAIYDFIGLEAMTGNPLERLAVHFWNRVWSKGYKKASRAINAVLFVGEIEDIPDRRMGFLLPSRRVWAEYRKVHYLGYVFPFSAADYADKSRIRQSLGYGGEPLIVASVGGTGIGGELLDLCGRAFRLARREIPGLRLVLVCGPRVAPDSLAVPEGAEVRAYVPDLYRHFAACDLAIVQGGGTTTLELTALRRPFLYFPLEGHFEQSKYVAARLARHKAGIPMCFSKTTPESLARQITANIGREASWPPIPLDGAQKGAEIISRFL